MPDLRDRQTEIEAILAKYPDKRSAVLPLCYLAQQVHGHMSADAIRQVAEVLDLDPTQVRGIVGFYSLLHEKPAGKHIIQICTDLPCALRGADELVEHACKKLGVQPGETTQDGLFTLETVMCIAACDKAPAAQIDLHYYENLDPKTFDQIVEQLRHADKDQTTGTGRL